MAADPTGHTTARIPRPFEGVYGVALPTAILALVPYIIVTSAYTLFRKQVGHDIGAGATGAGNHQRPFDRRVRLAAAGLLGLGAGATVSPGLYLAASSLPSRIVGRTFALVELVRSVADFILAPVMLAGTVLYLPGRPGLPRPDLVARIERNRPAVGSPPLAEALRES